MNSLLCSSVYSVVNVFAHFSREFSHIEAEAFRYTVDRSTREPLPDTVPTVRLHLATCSKIAGWNERDA